MKETFFLLFLFITFNTYSQEIKISGMIKDNQNRSIQNASVSLLDDNNENLGYNFTDENGKYSISFKQTKTDKITFEVSCLGYKKVIQTLTINSNTIQNFSLEEKLETLQEVVIEANKKIRIEQDTTTIKVASFGNKTEQTVEDILKKLTGIEVLKDGSVKAHGKPIDKLLIEGEDMFDKNYKLLSKNLDAKVLDAVQIIDNFEDNPVLKKMNNSDKVALNLKLKKGKKNIWFGNLTIGSGLVSENRWKESINLGLLKKKIKLFYLSDYNNLGEKASDLITANVLEKNTFSDDRFEYKAKSLFNINSNEIVLFSKTQSIINTAFLNSLSFTKKINSKLKIRGVIYITDDKQKQNSFSETKYNLETNPISFTENNLYTNDKTITSTELELKYYPNDKNYVTNLFIFKDNPNKTNSDLFYNSDQINQSSKNKNYTFYNHFNHTFQLSENKVLNNYIYFGNDKIREKTLVFSSLLNTFLNVNSNDIVNQTTNNNNVYIGEKTKLISKFRKLDTTNSLQFEYNKEEFNNTFLVNSNNFSQYENNSKLNQLKLIIDNALRYNFSKKIDFTANLSLQKIIFESNTLKNDIFLINPTISLNIKKTGFGNFNLSFSENSTLPEINQLTSNSLLIDYRSFSKGTYYHNPLKNTVTSFNYYIYNDEKRFSINTSIFYIKSKSIFNAESTLTNDFNFSNYKQTIGGENYNFNFSFVNYIRKLKLASKIETIQMWNSTPISVNSNEFATSKNYTNTIKYSATTYFKTAINFDGGFSYNYSQSIFENNKTNNITKDLFFNINYTISKTILAECNNAMYFVNSQNYSFNNIIINYNPMESKFSYRLIFNNILNENNYTFISLSNYTFYQSSVQLVPRYLLGSVKYRF